MAPRAGDPGLAQAKSPALSFVMPFLDTLCEIVPIKLSHIRAMIRPSPLASATILVQQLTGW
jgi:hypothetical protein